MTTNEAKQCLREWYDTHSNDIHAEKRRAFIGYALTSTLPGYIVFDNVAKQERIFREWINCTPTFTPGGEPSIEELLGGAPQPNNYIRRLENTVDSADQTAQLTTNLIQSFLRHLESGKFHCGDELDGYINVKDVQARLNVIQSATGNYIHDRTSQRVGASNPKREERK